MEIREATRKHHRRIIGEQVHIDRTHQVPMPGKLAGAAGPLSAFRFVFMPTCRTAARCSSFRAAEAHDVGRFGLVREVVHVLAIFPQGHPLVVVTTTITIAHAVRITDEESANLLFDTEVDDFACGFVPLVANTPLGTFTLLVFRSLELLPAPRILFAAGLLLRDLPDLLTPEMFERTNTTPGHDHRRPGVRRHRRQVNLAQISGRLDRAGSLFSLWYLDTHMQLKAMIPDETARPAVFGQING